MELRDSRDSGDTITAQLSQWLPFSVIDIHKAIHIANTETMN